MLRSLLTTVAFLAVSLPSAVSGMLIDEDMTLDETYPGEAISVRDGLTPPTTVTIDGAVIKSANSHDTSILNVLAGGIVKESIAGEYVLAVWDDSTVNWRGGRLDGSNDYGVQVLHNGTFNLEGGEISSNRRTSAVFAQDQGNVHVSGGVVEGYEIPQAILFEGEHLSISGGEVGPIRYWSTVGGTPVVVRGDATAEITGGILTSDMSRFVVEVEDSVIADVRGGEFHMIDRYEGTIATVPHFIRAKGSSTVNLYGGQTFVEPLPGVVPELPRLVAEDAATINVFGTDLALADNVLTGILADGTPIEYQTVGNIVVHEIPEPTAGLLILAGAFGTLATVRRRQQRPAAECRR